MARGRAQTQRLRLSGMRFCCLFLMSALGALCADWNPRAAADYLDARQKTWIAWPAASASAGAPCVSCHTGLTYLLARPALARALGETAPPEYQKILLATLSSRVAKRDPKELYPSAKEPHLSEEAAVESIFAALFLKSEDALDRMWALQIRGGADAGSWHWNQFDLDPWETPDSAYFGTALAAIAVGSMPAEYRSRPGVRTNIDAMTAYLRRRAEAQPLHNRLAALWASSQLEGILNGAERKGVVEAAWSKQQPDGGWTLDSLGPFQNHPTAPTAAGSNGYATAFAAFALRQAGTSPSDARLERALAWIRAHQDPQSGFWEAVSMNKVYKPDSMMAQFMRDAATAYASLALIGPEAAAKR
jgi:squalene-hopene/tetraprenyl-beta-curcumene cyclase